MTRKDYVLIADAIKKAKEFCDASGVSTISLRECASSIAFELKTDNPRFDDVRFLKACEVYRNA